jgi:hypothetical protein
VTRVWPGNILPKCSAIPATSTRAWNQLFIVSDPSAALSAVSLLLTPLLTRTAGGLATGTAAGLYHGRPFLLIFTL